jgi:hypothetical protein
MEKPMAGVVVAAVAVFSATQVPRGKCLALRYVGVVDGSNLAGRKMPETPKIRMHSGDGGQRTSVPAGNEELVDVSDTGPKLHILVAVAVAEDLLAAKADALMSKCHGLGLPVGLFLSVAVGIQDGPIRCQEKFVVTENRAAAEVDVEAVAAEAAAQDQGRRDQGCSSNLQVVRNSHAISPAWGFELIAPW